MPSNHEAGLQHKERFETYLLGLIFTLLAASIQTAKFGVVPMADITELLAWLFLLVSGLAGLSRAEWMSEIYRRYSLQDGQDEKIRIGKEAKLKGEKSILVLPTGKSVSVDEWVASAEEGRQQVEAAIGPLEKRLIRRYDVMKYSFVVALCLLVFARGYPPALEIWKALAQ